MMCLSVDPCKSNIALLVADIQQDKNTATVLYSTSCGCESKDLALFHKIVFQELKLVFSLYELNLVTIEMQPKGTHGRVYMHNLYNTNVQGMVYAMASLLDLKTAIVDPKEWHLVLKGQPKGIIMYKKMTLLLNVNNKYLLNTVHEYDALAILISQFI